MACLHGDDSQKFSKKEKGNGVINGLQGLKLQFLELDPADHNFDIFD
jgi:hypothetical protein